ncbi:cell division protein SepF [Methanobrevibacter sp.]|uniref:cell division protein SepF n=1 Tax=Methanobrevibacter sp. TaxID=66852 RepID=UPI00387055B7
MSFTDDLKRSLGFEETESGSKQNNSLGIMDGIREILKPKENPNRPQQNNQHQYQPNSQQPYGQPRHTQSPNPRPQPKPPVADDFDDFVIVPEQSFYEIVLIRPKTLDDINYVVDQVLEEKNPVILDLSFLEKESAPNFKLAGEKIKQMRAKYGAQALLLSRTEDKNLIIVSPKKVKVINKG